MSYPQKAPAESGHAASFKARHMKIVITLAAGSFAGGGNQYTITDLAMSATVEKLPWPDGGKCSVEIWGLPLDVMEQLSTLAFRPFYRTRNYINIFAGEGYPDGMPQIFAGSIATAGADFNSAPDVKFKIEGQVGFFGRIQAQGQTAVHGQQAAEDFIRGQAEGAGFRFRNEGVSASLSNCVFSGSGMQQAQTAANMIGAELVYDDEEAILLPSGGTIAGATTDLTPETGLLGYPVITQSGVEVKTIFNPELRFAGCINLKTSTPKASGTWRIVKLSHKIAANKPGDGSWESHVTGFYPAMSGAAGRFI